MPTPITLTPEQREIKRAEHVLNNPAAKRALRVIYPLLEAGKALTRAEFIQFFMEAGYVEQLAEQRADQFILVRTNPNQRFPFIVSRDNGNTVYTMSYEERIFYTRFVPRDVA